MFVVSDQRLTGLIAPITPYYSTQGEWLGLGWVLHWAHLQGLQA